MSENPSTNERLIKKYPNRRLYDTHLSAYITLAEIKQYVLDNIVFKVIDAKNSDDLTRSILLQIILEEESGGKPMFSANVLAQIIRFYGNAMQGVMGAFLEKNMQVFMDIQDQMASQSHGMYPNTPEAWAQLMSMQTPALQNVMSNYIDQSRSLFMQMQDQMQDQTRNMFSAFQFPGKGDNNNN